MAISMNMGAAYGIAQGQLSPIFVSQGLFQGIPNITSDPFKEGVRSVLASVLPFFSSFSANLPTPNCLPPDCPDLIESGLHPREVLAMKVIDLGGGVFSRVKAALFPPEFTDAQEFLRLRKDDPRDKFLYLMAEWDYFIGPMDPAVISNILVAIAAKFDLKFKIVRSLAEICSEVREAAKAGKLTHVLINAHGSPGGMLFSEDTQGNKRWALKRDDFQTCFSGLQPYGKIIHLSCSTGKAEGKDPDDHLAQVQATAAKRPVIAATAAVNALFADVISTDPITFYHPELSLKSLFWKAKNIFKIFLPEYRSCPYVKKETLHPQEQLIADSISYDLVARSLLSDEAPFAEIQDYFRLCQEDPKNKFLVLSDTAQAHLINTELLGRIADRFDVQYKIIDPKNLCEEVQRAAKIGTLAYVILATNADVKKECFAGLDPRGRIILIGKKLGSSEAQGIANGVQRTLVIATDGGIPRQIKTVEISPFMIHQNGRVREKNLFQIFNPENGECPDVLEYSLHFRERLALDAMKTDMVATSRLSESAGFRDLQQFARLCANDPRKKFLYFLSSNTWGVSDENWKDIDGKPRFQYPEMDPELLSQFGRRFDFKFQAFQKFKDICNAVQKAAKVGSVAGVVIDAQSLDDSLLLNASPACFSALEPSARIVILGRPIGVIQDRFLYPADPKNHIAQQLTNAFARPVIASVEPVSPSKIRVTSMDSLNLFHPQQGDSKKNAFNEFT